MAHCTDERITMRRPAVDYELVCCASRQDIADTVRMRMEEGWRVCGSIGGGDGAYYLTMIRFLH